MRTKKNQRSYQGFSISLFEKTRTALKPLVCNPFTKRLDRNRCTVTLLLKGLTENAVFDQTFS